MGVRTYLAGRHWTRSEAALPCRWQPFRRFVPQLQRAFPIKAVTASWLTIQTSQSWYLSALQKLAPKFSDHLWKKNNNKQRTSGGICWKRECSYHRYQSGHFEKSVCVSRPISDSDELIINNCTCFSSQKSKDTKFLDNCILSAIGIHCFSVVVNSGTGFIYFIHFYTITNCNQ